MHLLVLVNTSHRSIPSPWSGAAALVRGSARCCTTDSTRLPAISAHLVAGVLPEVAASSLLLARGKEQHLPSPLTSGNLSKFVSGNVSEARSDLIWHGWAADQTRPQPRAGAAAAGWSRIRGTDRGTGKTASFLPFLLLPFQHAKHCCGREKTQSAGLQWYLNFNYLNTIKSPRDAL